MPLQVFGNSDARLGRIIIAFRLLVALSLLPFSCFPESVRLIHHSPRLTGRPIFKRLVSCFLLPSADQPRTLLRQGFFLQQTTFVDSPQLAEPSFKRFFFNVLGPLL